MASKQPNRISKINPKVPSKPSSGYTLTQSKKQADGSYKEVETKYIVDNKVVATIKKGGGSKGEDVYTPTKDLPSQGLIIDTQGTKATLLQDQATIQEKAQSAKEQVRQDLIKQEKVNIDLSQVQGTSLGQPLRETSSNFNIKKVSIPEVQLYPYVKEEIIGSVKSQGKDIPTVKYTYVDPRGAGSGIQTERPATESEIKKLRDEKKALSLETGTASIKKIPFYKPSYNKVVELYNKLDQDLREGITYPIAGGLGKVGVTKESTSKALAYTNPLALTNKSIREFYEGIYEGVIEDVKEKPLKQVALYGAGNALGLAFKGGSVALSSIPKVGKIASPVFKVGATGYGAYATIGIFSEQGQNLASGKSFKEKGSSLGVEIKDVALLGVGFTRGEKAFDIVRGNIRTRGLKEIEVKQGEYPTAPTKKQLELFNKNVYKEISDEAIAFHTTPDVFYSSGKITPQAGTSELAGLYVSTQVSTPFSKIQGSSSQSVKSFEAFQRAIKNLFFPENKAGIASLEPKGFREVQAVKSKQAYFVDINKANLKTGEGFFGYEFTKPPKKGFLDLPLIKTEIEAIARIDAGSYEATGKRFYTKIKGVKVPIDSFKYTEDLLNKNIKELQKNIVESNKKLRSGGYSSYEAPTLRSSLPSSSLNFSVKEVFSSIKSSIEKNTSVLKSSDLKSGYSRSSYSSSASPSNSSNSSSRRSGSSSSGTSNSSSGSSSNSSSRSNNSFSRSSSGSSSVLSSGSFEEATNNPLLFRGRREDSRGKKSLGQGYNVYGKQLKSNKFFKINNYPLTKSRAQDVGAFYVSNTLARTFRVEKANQRAEEDYQFTFIPSGFFSSRKATLREFKIKQRRQIETPEQFIQKSRFLLSSPAEKKQIQNFRRQVKAILR